MSAHGLAVLPHAAFVIFIDMAFLCIHLFTKLLGNMIYKKALRLIQNAHVPITKRAKAPRMSLSDCTPSPCLEAPATLSLGCILPTLSATATQMEWPCLPVSLQVGEGVASQHCRKK